jgi:4-hydroxy-tetrahydrodipicolinate synthase
MARFDHLKGVFGLLPTPYSPDFEVYTPDLCAAADFCVRNGQHGIVWPVMVGEFHLLGEEERIRNLDAVLASVNGRLPVVFGCSGLSVPQVVLYARAAEKAGPDAVIAMPPARTDAAIAMDMFRRIADVYSGPIIVQNSSAYAPLSGEQIARLVDEIPQIQYIKEERAPGPRHISEVYKLVGDKVKTIFGGYGGRFMPDELRRGANGCMPACEIADLLAKVIEVWWTGDQARARAMHTRLLPLINKETYPFMRYMLQRRGVFTTTVERALPGPDALDAEDKREISILIEAIQDEVKSFPFGAE